MVSIIIITEKGHDNVHDCIFVCLEDIDECIENTDNCEQVCENTIGSFSCDCNPGYQLNIDGTTCEGEIMHCPVCCYPCMHESNNSYD